MTNFVEENDHCIIPPNSFVLARTVEKFKIPDDVLCICVGKINICKMWNYCKCHTIENDGKAILL